MTNERARRYTIKQLSSEFDVTPRTLRYYEDQGLLSPERRGQHRIYHATDRIRLAWILRGRRVGFSLAEIGEMLDLYDLGDGRETQRAVTIERCKERIKALEAQREDINATLNELKGFADLISTMTRDSDTGQWIHADTGEPVASFGP
ncbi:MAG: MerR family DNA-binding transcriptional regulator [Kordiimonadaceae bacterium]|nr:MerR family DNA-binding transcriptional regulator [Kordiimonadaceae bacterium]MBO6567926.1 MerR family DNA-binding transcriptional regulator [Kordiimonadaceae bacterium]MBO6964344.1 MerR family DNA-binding transcriptional regulator [Kordiimonadaceae bacterium]